MNCATGGARAQLLIPPRQVNRVAHIAFGRNDADGLGGAPALGAAGRALASRSWRAELTESMQ